MAELVADLRMKKPRTLTAKGKQQTIQRLVKRYATALGLAAWDITIEWHEKNDEFTAACQADHEYERATLRFVVSEMQADQLARFVRHELFHAVLWPLSHTAYHLAADDPTKDEMVRLAMEAVTTHIEKLAIWDA